MSNNNTILPVAVLSALLLQISCMKIEVPANYVYTLHPSEDMLELFFVDVQYLNHRNESIEERVTDTEWHCTIFQLDDSSPKGINITLTAKPYILLGNIPDRDCFSLYLNPEVTFTPQGRYPVGRRTKAEEQVSFSFKVPAGSSSPEQVSISICPLKYDKHFAFSFSLDDSSENGWSKLFAQFNGLWIDELEFFHYGLMPTQGYQAEALCVTDGCGNDRRFTFGESIQPNYWNNDNRKGIIQDVITSRYNPYISWEELQMLTDLGNAVYWHDINDKKWDVADPEQIKQGFEEDYGRTMDKIGYPMKTLAQPNGSDAYLEAGKTSPLVYMTRVTNNKYSEICFDENPELYKAEVFGGSNGFSFEDKLEELAIQSESVHPVLLSMFSLRPQEDALEFFRKIAELYGKDGADNIWVTSYDELYDYTRLKQNAVITSSARDGFIHFEVTLPKFSDSIYNELSFSIKGVSEAAQCTSDELYGFSSAVREDGSVLVNCNFGKRSLDMAEKYVGLYEDTRSEYHRNFALYLSSLLREELRRPLQNRIEGVHEPTMEEMPLEGDYSRKQISDYIRLYHGYTLSLE